MTFIFQANIFAQNDCEVFCSVTNTFINVCNETGLVIAADNCADADFSTMSDLDGFATTTCAFSPDGPGGLPGFCGPGTIVHNNMWIAFQPDVSGRLHFNIEIIDCLSTNNDCNGIQAAISRALCTNPGNVFSGFEYESLDCVNCVDQTFDLITVDAIAGVPHYLMIDGCCGDACEIIINVLEGLDDQPWSVETSNATGCPDLITNCLSPNSSLFVSLSANDGTNPTAELSCDWFGPDGQLIVQQTNNAIDGKISFNLTGVDPNSNLPYACELGQYSAVINDPESSWTRTLNLELQLSEVSEITFQLERIDNDADCMEEEILLSAQIVDPGLEVLFSFWYKVDYGTSPPTRVQVSDPSGSNDESLLISRNDPMQGDGDYIYSFLDRDAFCISEKLITINFNEGSCSANAGTDMSIDCLNFTATLDASESCGPVDLIYEWTAPGGIVSNGPILEATDPGTYVLVITDPNSGCSDTDQVEVFGNYNIPSVSFEYLNGSSPLLNCDNPTAEILMTSDNSGDSFQWIFPSGETTEENPIITDEPGLYTLIVTNLANGCTSSSNLQLLYDDSYCTFISGTIYNDNNEDCEKQIEEQLLGGWLLEFDDGVEPFFRYVKIGGAFVFEIEPGTYDISLVPINEAWQSCPSTTVTINENDRLEIDFGAQSILPCPMPIVDLVVPRLRRCVNNAVFITYTNQGTVVSENTYIDLTLDEYHEIVSANLAYEDLGEDLYRFQLGTLAPFAIDKLEIVVATDCDVPFGLTHCFKAEIFPQIDCFTPADWDGSSLSVNGAVADDKIKFIITNDGEDMTSAVNSWIIEDDVLMRMDNILLNAANGNIFEIELDCSSSTYRLEVEQSPNHPGMSFPCATIEGCDGMFTPGFVNQFPQDTDDPRKDVVCIENIDSYDPNDKLGLPLGVSEAHCVPPGRQLDYTIRFQNTGTAEALKVVLTDFISKNLDMRTLKITGASHDYTFEIDENRTLVFTFDDINLPWEEKDEEGSNGFVQFSIFPLSDIELGTEIENDALIYFDFNDPIQTNTTFHTIDVDCIEEDIVSNISQSISNNSFVFPNPFSNEFTISLEKVNKEKLSFKLFDMTGKQLDQVNFYESKMTYKAPNIQSGIYFYEISSESDLIGSGKLIKM